MTTVSSYPHSLCQDSLPPVTLALMSLLLPCSLPAPPKIGSHAPSHEMPPQPRVANIPCIAFELRTRSWLTSSLSSIDIGCSRTMQPPHGTLYGTAENRRCATRPEARLIDCWRFVPAIRSWADPSSFTSALRPSGLFKQDSGATCY